MKFKIYIKNPKKLIIALAERGLMPMLSDEAFLKIKFKMLMGYKLNLNEPKTFNEKLQWLKLHDRNPEYTMLVDKYEVKKYVAEKVGAKYIIPTLGVWDRAEDIDFDSLPEQFVLKCTHDSGSVIICRDKQHFSRNAAISKLHKALQKNLYYYGREWPYKNVKPRIIAEKYMEDESGYELKDYKVFTFNGEPKIIQVDFGRYNGRHCRNFYNLNWKYMDMEILYPADASVKIERPQKLDEMLQLSRKLATGPHVRIDLYSIRNRIYFGEMTFYHGNGFEEFRPFEWDLKFGEWLRLPCENQ